MKMPKVRSPTLKMGSSFPAAYTDGNALIYSVMIFLLGHDFLYSTQYFE